MLQPERTDMHTYPWGFRIRTPKEQLEIWTEIFPHLKKKYCQELILSGLPIHEEGWAVIPKPSAISTDYHGAFKNILQVMKERIKLHIKIDENDINPQRLVVKWETSKVLAAFEKTSGDDFLIFPFQFGIGLNSDSAATIRMSDSQFPLGPYEIVCLFITHPDRIVRINDLGIDCLGCGFFPKNDEMKREWILSLFSITPRMRIPVNSDLILSPCLHLSEHGSHSLTFGVPTGYLPLK